MELDQVVASAVARVSAQAQVEGHVGHLVERVKGRPLETDL